MRSVSVSEEMEMGEEGVGRGRGKAEGVVEGRVAVVPVPTPTPTPTPAVFESSAEAIACQKCGRLDRVFAWLEVDGARCVLWLFEVGLFVFLCLD